MIEKKYCNKVIIVLVAIAVAVCLTLMLFSDKITEKLGGKGVQMGYEEKLFDTSSIIDLNITIDQDKWDDMLENAMDEEYFSCDVTVNGTTFSNVGIRTKGNMSLSSVVQDPDSDRYSFKIEFDHYNEGQTCFGLDKLILNNNYADATNMKEAVVYDMFKYLGADASLYNYAKISVNGEYWGVYLALEGVEDSFLMRNYGAGSGELYKPESMNGGGGGRPGESQNGGADLNYTDDDLDSYSVIWDGEVNKTKKADHKRVVKALKNISEGNELETYMDVDNMLKYMAVHTFVVNLDSLSGNMAHNYYLYEEAGKLNLIPWDYNLAFGGFMQSGASDTVNFAIDTPFSNNISMEDRQFFAALLENQTYLEQYHKYLRQLCEDYVGKGSYEKVYNRIRQQIDSLVSTDPNSFYTYEEYDEAAQMLSKVINLRKDSILGQLSGEIPSTSEGQKSDQSTLIDTTGIDLNVMGSMNKGGMGGGPGNMPGHQEQSESKNTDTKNTQDTTQASTQMIQLTSQEKSDTATENSQSSQKSTNGMPGNNGQAPQENTDGMPGNGQAPQENADGMPGNGQASQENADGMQGNGQAPQGNADGMPGNGQPPQGGRPDNAPMPGNGPMGKGQEGQSTTQVLPTFIWLGVSLVVGVAGLIIAKKYRRKSL